MEAQQGTMTVVIGPNGAGKSTTLKTIFGFLHPKQGEIRFLDQRIDALDLYQIKNLDMSYIPQEIVLRMSAIYLAVAMWAFAEVIRILVSANFRLTHGDAGLSVPPLLGTLDPFPYYYLFLGLMIFFLLVMYIVVNMPVGAFMRAIKDDDLAPQAIGINTVRWRLFVFSHRGHNGCLLWALCLTAQSCDHAL